jgi:uncharacterized protein
VSPPALAGLERALDGMGAVVVGFSGGADSSLLAYVSRRRLGRSRAVAVTAVSPSLAPEELDDCRALAEEWDLEWRPVATAELSRPEYRANGRDRCYHCKTELMSVLRPLAEDRAATVVLGVNTDDLADHRPGQQAAEEAGARFPFVEAGLSKADVRSVSGLLGLRTASKPAQACLASRVPYGTAVTFPVLDRVARAESGLRSLGFSALRVRHYGDVARIEVPVDELGSVVRLRADVVAAVRAAGYRYVTLDLEGLRSGNLNG